MPVFVYGMSVGTEKINAPCSLSGLARPHALTFANILHLCTSCFSSPKDVRVRLAKRTQVSRFAESTKGTEHAMRLPVRHLVWVAALLAQALLAECKGKDYYETLGLKKNAKDAAIKKAYRWV